MEFGVDEGNRMIVDSPSVFTTDMLRPLIRDAEAARCPAVEVRQASPRSISTRRRAAPAAAC